VIKPVEIKMRFLWLVPLRFFVFGLIVMWFLWLLSCIDFDFVFNFCVHIDPVLLIGIDWSKVDVGDIVGFAITIIAWVAFIAWLLWSVVMFW